jgi:hypothetical protein
MAMKRTVSPITRQQRKKNSEVPSKVKIWKIVPEVPQDEGREGRVIRGPPNHGVFRFTQETLGFQRRGRCEGATGRRIE